MKKHLFSVLAVATALILGLSSCAKEDPASPLNADMTQTATIIGYITYEPNLSIPAPNTTVFVPSANVKITATMNYSDIKAGTTGKFILPTSYDESTGLYKVEVPATNNAAANVTVSIDSYVGTQIDGANVTKKGTWKPTSPGAVAVNKGETTRSDVTFAFTAAPIQ